MTMRLLEANFSIPAGAGQTAVFTVAAADAEGMIGKNGSMRPYALRFIGDAGADITVKKVFTRRVSNPNEGQFVALKSTNGWLLADLNALASPEAGGLDLPRYEVADGYEIVVECDNANGGAVVVTLAMKVQNIGFSPGPVGLVRPQQAGNAIAQNAPNFSNLIDVPIGPGTPFGKIAIGPPNF
jgi:hypothetical protein